MNKSKTSVPTLNVRGLNNSFKQEKKFLLASKLKGRHHIQETLCTEKNIQLILNLTGMVKCLSHALTQATAEEWLFCLGQTLI